MIIALASGRKRMKALLRGKRQRQIERERERWCGKGRWGDMDGGDTCKRMPSYGEGAQDKTITTNRLVLRFRPIAPKPVTRYSFPGQSPIGNKNSGKISKRKYVRVRKNNNGRKKRISSDQETEEGESHVVSNHHKRSVATLQLMPEKNTQSSSPPPSELGRTVDTKVVVDEKNYQDPPMWLKLNNSILGDSPAGPVVSDRAVVVASQMKPVVVETRVTVECVTDSFAAGFECTDVERMENLDKDTCPGFITDGINRVRWVNEAYKRMVMRQEGDHSTEIRVIVWLVMKEKLIIMPCLYGAFSCRVRLQYTWQEEKYSKMVPCDVWRMECGGYAWRLDTKAELSLGI